MLNGRVAKCENCAHDWEHEGYGAAELQVERTGCQRRAIIDYGAGPPFTTTFGLIANIPLALRHAARIASHTTLA